MAHPNYSRGRKKEYRVAMKLRKEGYLVIRSAGSHGFADLVAISVDKQEIRFIQCKPRNFPKSKEKKLMEEWLCFNEGRVFESTFEVI